MKTTHSFLFFGLAVAYLIALPFMPFHYDWLFKMLPVASLLWPVWLLTPSTQKSWLLAAVIFSFVGDGLLTVSFVAGLASFLTAQLCYARLFWFYRKRQLPRRTAVIILLIYLITIASWLWPHLGEMRVPVVAYMLAIGSMGLLAITSRLHWWSAVIGALFFIASDSMIAINKFIMPLPLRDYLILGSYFFAQWALVNGFLVVDKK